MTGPRDEGGPERRPGQPDPLSTGGYDGEDDGSAPRGGDGRGRHADQAGYGAPGGYGPPPGQGGYGAQGGQQGGYGTPPGGQRGGYGPPPAQGGYGGQAPDQGGYGAPGGQAAYGPPAPLQGGYGAPPGQGGYGGPPGYGAPAGFQQPYQGAGPGYAYNLYGSPPAQAYPGDPEPERTVKRPGLMILALLFMILAALPFLLGGIAVLVIPFDLTRLPPEVLDNPQLKQAGATPELLISAFRAIGVILIVIAAIYLLLAFLAFARRNWARILVAVLSVGFALLLAAGLVQAGIGPDNLIVIGIPLLLLVLSVVILFLPASNAWYATRRR